MLYEKLYFKFSLKILPILYTNTNYRNTLRGTHCIAYKYEIILHKMLENIEFKNAYKH